MKGERIKVGSFAFLADFTIQESSETQHSNSVRRVQFQCVGWVERNVGNEHINVRSFVFSKYFNAPRIQRNPTLQLILNSRLVRRVRQNE